ncbi:MAG: hypothetical protein ACFFD4_14400 [Candidatus Odinarchaeota archaeon]
METWQFAWYFALYFGVNYPQLRSHELRKGAFETVKNQLTEKQARKLDRDKSIVNDYRKGVNCKQIMEKYGIKSDKTVL